MTIHSMTKAANQALLSFSEIILPVSFETFQQSFILNKFYGYQWYPPFLQEICKQNSMLMREAVTQREKKEKKLNKKIKKMDDVSIGP